MSYTLIQERQVKAARKAHRCIWCGEAIAVGTPYTYERSVFEGDPQTHHWHGECLSQMRAIAHNEGSPVEFNAYSELRPEQPTRTKAHD